MLESRSIGGFACWKEEVDFRMYGSVLEIVWMILEDGGRMMRLFVPFSFVLLS